MKASKLIRMTLALLMVLAALPVLAGRADDADRKSKNGKTEGKIDGVSVMIEYGRPEARDRDIFGALVPYGKMWRTGADEATTLTVSHDVTLDGHKLAAGTYALFTVPGEKEWQVVLNSEAKQWGAYKRDPAKDVVTFNVTPASGDHVEAMDFVIEGSKVTLRWAKTTVSFTVAKA
ncbi:MAG: DUF2911 domain-containing protein [Acidobacteriota bacterium]